MSIVKRCSTCKQTKEIKNFWKNTRYLDGYMGVCKSCRNSAKRKQREDPEYRNKENRKRRETRGTTRWVNIKAKYGLTEEDYNLIITDQKDKCLICEEELKEPHIDHCHTTGRVRGVLCSRCNTGLGKFKDSVQMLEKAKQYLRGQEYGTS